MITKLIVMNKSNILVQVDIKRLIISKITFINFGWWTHQTYHVLRGEINNLLFYKVNLISFFIFTGIIEKNPIQMSSQQSVDGNPPPTKKLKPDAGTTGDTPPFTTVTMATPATLISTNVTSTNNLQQGSVISVTFSNGECLPHKCLKLMSKEV